MNGNVSFRDDPKMPLSGRGKILICLKDGRHQFISNVYYVSNMKSKGYDIHMKDYSLFIRDIKGITNVKISKNIMFSLNIQNDIEKHVKTCYKDTSWLWHL